MTNQIDEGEVGQATNFGFAQGTNQNLRLGGLGDLIKSECHGKAFNQAINGNVFATANQGVVTTSTTLNTTFTGLGIANPAGSGVNIVLLKFLCTMTAVGVAAAVALAGGIGTLTAAGPTAVNTQVGSTVTSKAVISNSSAITAPLLLRPIGSVGSQATTGHALIPSLQDDIAGSIIIPPGSYIVTDTTTANAGLVFGFVWEEVAIGVV